MDEEAAWHLWCRLKKAGLPRVGDLAPSVHDDNRDALRIDAKLAVVAIVKSEADLRWYYWPREARRDNDNGPIEHFTLEARTLKSGGWRRAKLEDVMDRIEARLQMDDLGKMVGAH